MNIGDSMPEGISKLKKEQGIYLYGTGTYARKMLGILNNFDIDVEGVLVSKQFGCHEQFFCGKKVYIAEEFLSTIDSDIVVVAGFHVLYLSLIHI